MHGAVKNQGGCGSCWAFGAAASLESWIAMQNYTLDGGNMMDVSEQVPIIRGPHSPITIGKPQPQRQRASF
jgi:Papain family cysteine protease